MKRVLSILALGAISLISSQASAQVDRSFHAGGFVADDGAGNSVKLKVSGVGNNTISFPAGADATVLLTTGGQTVTGAMTVGGAFTLSSFATAGIVHNIAGGLLSSAPITGADISNASITNANLVNSGVTLTAGTGVNVTGGSLSLGGTATIAIGQDVASTASPSFVSATFTGKPTAGATLGTDANGTLTTKGYVDAAAAGSLAGAVILAPGASARNLVQPSGDFTALALKANATQTSDLLDFLPSSGVTPLAAVTGSGKGKFTGLDATNAGIANAGAITGATGITSSGTITLSSLSDGVAHVVSGVLSGSKIVNADITPATITNASLANSGVTLTSGTGVTVTGGALSLGGSATIAIGQDVATTASPTFVGATFTGKPVAASTVSTDAATTLTTKGYVDTAAGSSLTNAVILAPGASTRNVVQATGNFTSLAVKAATGQTSDLLDFLPSASSTPVAMINPAGGATFTSLATGAGAISGGAISGTTVAATGAVTGASVTATGTVQGLAVQGTTVNVTGNLTGSGTGKFAGKVSVAGLNTITVSAPNVTSASTVILTYENTSSPSVGGQPGYFISSYDNAAHTFTVVLLSNGPVGSSLNYMVIN